jgi:hypothetical protein
MIPFPTSPDVNVPEDEPKTVEPYPIEPSEWEIAPGPAPITCIYLFTSEEVNDPLGDVRVVEPALMAPSVRRIPSGVAPYVSTLYVV